MDSFLDLTSFVYVFVSSLVIDTLKDVDPSRKCFRLVGGVLVERTVKEVLPALETNKEQVMVENRKKTYVLVNYLLNVTCKTIRRQPQV